MSVFLVEIVQAWARGSSSISSPRGVTVTNPSGTYTAGQLVVCPGAWAPVLLTELGIPITIERQVLYWLDPAGGTAPFEDHPIYINENAHGEQIYGWRILLTVPCLTLLLIVGGKWREVAAIAGRALKSPWFAGQLPLTSALLGV